MAAMELIRRTFTRRGWLDADDHALLVAVSRLTPGTNILAYCTALGWQMHRAAGVAAALLAGSVPGAIFVFVLTAALVRLDRYPLVQALLAAGMLAAAVLVFSTAWHLIRPYLTGRRRVLAAAVVAATAALLALDVSPVRILLASAIVGALWPTRDSRIPPARAETRPARQGEGA